MTQQTELSAYEEGNRSLVARLQRTFDTAGGGKLRDRTRELRDIVGIWYMVESIDGPADLGKGPVYILSLIDCNGQIETTWCGSQQFVAQMEAEPSTQDAVNTGSVQMAVLFSLSTLKNGNSFYTVKAWFGLPGDTGPLLGSF